MRRKHKNKIFRNVIAPTLACKGALISWPRTLRGSVEKERWILEEKPFKGYLFERICHSNRKEKMCG